MFLVRITLCASFAGSFSRSTSAILSRPGTRPIQLGVRWSIVTWAARSAIDGTRVIAVAPLPMITTRLSS